MVRFLRGYGVRAANNLLVTGSASAHLRVPDSTKPLATNTGGVSGSDCDAIRRKGSRQLAGESRKISKRLPGWSTVPAKIAIRIRNRHSARSSPEITQTTSKTKAGKANSKYRVAKTLWSVRCATTKKAIGPKVIQVAIRNANSGRSGVGRHRGFLADTNS